MIYHSYTAAIYVADQLNKRVGHPRAVVECLDYDRWEVLVSYRFGTV